MKQREKKSKDQYKKTILFLSSLVLMAIYTGIFAYAWLFYYNNREIAWGFHNRGNWVLILIYVLLLLVVARMYNAFKVSYMRLGDTVYSHVLSLLIVNVITYFQLSLIARELLHVLPFVLMTVADIVFMFLWAWSNRKLFAKLYPPHNMIMVYGSKLAETISEKMQSRGDRYSINRYVHIDEGMEAICQMIPDYESVIICDVPSKQRNLLLKFCFKESIRVYMVPKISDILIRGAEEIHMFDSPILLSRNIGLNFSQRFFKRLLDLLLVIPLTVIASPFMLVIAIAIKLYDRGPVIYKQERLTLNEKKFFVYKFRSMIVDAEKDGRARLASEKDDRITPVGKIIRKIRMDELPQLFNILFGQMSFVGPRPERPEIAAAYEKEMPEFRYRTKVKAGLTGYAQVLGKYNTTPYDKLKLDLTYIVKYSLLLDIQVIFMTLKIMFMSESTEGFTDNSVPNANMGGKTRLIDDTEQESESQKHE